MPIAMTSQLKSLVWLYLVLWVLQHIVLCCSHGLSKWTQVLILAVSWNNHRFSLPITLANVHIHLDIYINLILRVSFHILYKELKFTYSNTLRQTDELRCKAFEHIIYMADGQEITITLLCWTLWSLYVFKWISHSYIYLYLELPLMVGCYFSLRVYLLILYKTSSWHPVLFDNLNTVVLLLCRFVQFNQQYWWKHL